MSDKVIKFLIDPEIKEIDEKKRIITHKISVEKKDRIGDIVRVDGIDTKNYKKNPVVLYSHDYWSKDPLPVIGKNVGFIPEGKKLFAKTQFLNSDEVSPKLKDLINDLWYLNKNGLMGWSIGFIPTKTEDIKDEEDHWAGYDFKESELLEYSNVIIPANQEAINNAIQKGKLSKGIVREMQKKNFDYQNFYDNSIRLEDELPGELAEKLIEEKVKTKPSQDSQVLQGIMPDSIKTLQGIIEALTNSRKLLAEYLQKFTGGKTHE